MQSDSKRNVYRQKVTPCCGNIGQSKSISNSSMIVNNLLSYIEIVHKQDLSILRAMSSGTVSSNFATLIQRNSESERNSQTSFGLMVTIISPSRLRSQTSREFCQTIEGSFSFAHHRNAYLAIKASENCCVQHSLKPPKKRMNVFSYLIRE